MVANIMIQVNRSKVMELNILMSHFINLFLQHGWMIGTMGEIMTIAQMIRLVVIIGMI